LLYLEAAFLDEQSILLIFWSIEQTTGAVTGERIALLNKAQVKFPTQFVIRRVFKSKILNKRMKASIIFVIYNLLLESYH